MNLIDGLCSQVGTMWWSDSEQGFPVKIEMVYRWLSCHSKPWQSGLLALVFENLIFIVFMAAFLPKSDFSPGSSPSSRLSRLLLRLPALRLMNATITEELFFKGLIGNVRIDSVIPHILKMEPADYNSQIIGHSLWKSRAHCYELSLLFLLGTQDTKSNCCFQGICKY